MKELNEQLEKNKKTYEEKINEINKNIEIEKTLNKQKIKNEEFEKK